MMAAQNVVVHTALGLQKQPLRAPFGFKGGTLSQLWQVVVQLQLSGGQVGVGVGVQSVLWSDPTTFCQMDEAAGNNKMLAVTKQALCLLKGMEFTTPPQMVDALVPPLLVYARRLLGRADVPQTFVLNALVAVDFALWQLWNAKHGNGTFAALQQQFCPQLTQNATQLGGIPLVSYNTSAAEIARLLDEGTFLFKIKIGADPNRDNNPETMLQWDIQRLRTIHSIASAHTTPHTDCGHPVYYLDANGRYPDKTHLLRFLDAAGSMGALERIVLLEEPFAEDNLVPVWDIPVCVAGDESAHSAADVQRLTGQLGYKAIACKPIAKTLSVTLSMIEAAQQCGAACFCADLTVPPVLLDWNLSLAACLPWLNGLRMGVVESNGAQNYTNWGSLNAMCAVPNAPWRTPQNGVYRLGSQFNTNSGIFSPLPAYQAAIGEE